MNRRKIDRFAVRYLGDVADATGQLVDHLDETLPKALFFVRPEVYLARSYLYGLAVFAASWLLVIASAVLEATGVLVVPGGLYVALLLLPFVLAVCTFLTHFLIPDAKILTRRQDIDAKLPYALNYVSTVASAGMPPDQIFESLANQDVYGEISNEAGRISHDIRVMGKDLVTALTDASDRTPSSRFQSFLQGAITALTSGEDLEQYFRSKSEQFLVQNRQEERRFQESLGVLAESYVTVVVGAPVFLIVLLSMTFVFGESSPSEAIALGYGLVLVLIPLAQAGFVTVVKAITPEV